MVAELVNTEPVDESTDASTEPSTPATFDDLFAERYQPMVRLATLLVGNEAVAEELVQDTFVRVHHKWATVDHPAAYLRTAVVNACRNNRRRARLEQAHARTDAPAVAPPQEPLLDALATLDDERRARRHRPSLLRGLVRSRHRRRPRLSVRGPVKSLLSRGLTQLREVIEP